MHLFRNKVRYLRSAALIVGIGMAFAAFATVFAYPFAQGAQTVEITELVILDADTDDVESVFAKGAKVQIEVEFTDIRNLTAFDDDDSDFKLDYVVVLEVEDANEKTIYSTIDVPEGNKDLRLEPEQRKKIIFDWNAPYDTRTGGHNVIISVHDKDDFSNIQDEDKSKVIIQSSAGSVFVSESSIDFGDVEDEDTPRARIIVANPNRAAGELIWQITELPDWLELITPDASEDNSQESVLMTNNHTIILQVRSTVLKGTLNDTFKVESNAGTASVDVSVSVDRNANGLISRLKAQSSLYKPGDDVVFLYRIQNDGSVPMTYSVSFLVQAPTGSLFFNSNSQGLDAVVGPVKAGDETEGLEFTWTVPFGTLPGDYELGAQLRGYLAYEFLFDNVPFPSKAAKSGPPVRSEEVEEGDVFEIQKGALIEVAPPDWAFGAIKEGESDTASFAVSNGGRGTLEWWVVSLPDWLVLERPISRVSGNDSVKVSISESAPPGNLAGTIEIDSNGGPKSIKVSVRIIPKPTATVGIATVLARLLPTATPEPTATPSPIPSATPTPLPLGATILSGRLNIRNEGIVPDGTQLVAKIGDYTSPPAALQGDSYSSLVVLPPDHSYIGQSIEFYLGDSQARLTAPVFYFQDGLKRVDLTFASLPTATPASRLEATATTAPPEATPTAVVVVSTAKPTATATVIAPEPVKTETPQVFITAEAGEPSGPAAVGGCNATANNIGWATGLANTALLIMPIGLVAGARMNRRRRKVR